VTFTLSVVDSGAALQQTLDAGGEMAPAPIDPTAQLPPVLSLVADTTSQLDFRSVLERLNGFMKVANLAAEVCSCRSAVIQRLDCPICTFLQVHPLVKLAWGIVSVAYKVSTQYENV
jgi:hypothetical protein